MSSCRCCITIDPPPPNKCAFDTLNVSPVQPTEFNISINAGGFLNGTYILFFSAGGTQATILASPNLLGPNEIQLPDAGDNGCASRNVVPGDSEVCTSIFGKVPTLPGCSIVAYTLFLQSTAIPSVCGEKIALNITGLCVSSLTFGFVLLETSATYIASWPNWAVPQSAITMYLVSQPTLLVLGAPNPFVMPSTPSATKLIADFNGFPQSIVANVIL